MRTLYSIRDALGRELWWTSVRKAARSLCDDLNTIGDGACIVKAMNGSPVVVHMDDLRSPTPQALRDGHTLPVCVWKCTRQEPKETTK